MSAVGMAQIATLTVKDTGSVDRFRQFTTKVKGAAGVLRPEGRSVAGIHDLYLCFDHTSGDIRLDWWQFK